MLSFTRFAIAALLIATLAGPLSAQAPSGTEIVVRLRAPAAHPIDSRAAERVRLVLRRRLQPEVQIVAQGMGGSNALVLRVPAGVDVREVERRVRARGVLEFKEQRPTGWVTAMDGSCIRSAEDVRTDYGPLSVRFKLNGAGTKRFADLTRRVLGKLLGIFLDGHLLSSPVVREPILNGAGEISPITATDPAMSNQQEARSLAAILSSGALPVELQIVSKRWVKR